MHIEPVATFDRRERLLWRHLVMRTAMVYGGGSNPLLAVLLFATDSTTYMTTSTDEVAGN